MAPFERFDNWLIDRVLTPFVGLCHARSGVNNVHLAHETLRLGIVILLASELMYVTTRTHWSQWLLSALCGFMWVMFYMRDRRYVLNKKLDPRRSLAVRTREFRYRNVLLWLLLFVACLDLIILDFSLEDLHGWVWLLGYVVWILHDFFRACLTPPPPPPKRQVALRTALEGA